MQFYLVSALVLAAAATAAPSADPAEQPNSKHFPLYAQGPGWYAHQFNGYRPGHVFTGYNANNPVYNAGFSNYGYNNYGYNAGYSVPLGGFYPTFRGNKKE